MVRTHYIIMGVTGSGKTTIGSKLAKALRLVFLDADDFHPRSNIAKMATGVPLEDSDRLPWLSAVRDHLRKSDGCVLACSALKKSYRSIAADTAIATMFIHLTISRDTAFGRVISRPGHVMPADPMESQFRSLEQTNDLIVIDAEQPEASVLESVALALENR